MLPVSGAEQFMVSDASGFFASLDRNVSVVEVLQAFAGFAVGQEKVPKTFLLGFRLGLFQHLDLARCEAPAVGLAFAMLGVFDQHRIDSFTDEFLDVFKQRTNLIRHAQIVELVARIESVAGRARHVSVVFHTKFLP